MLALANLSLQCSNGILWLWNTMGTTKRPSMITGWIPEALSNKATGTDQWRAIDESHVLSCSCLSANINVDVLSVLIPET